MSDSTIDDHKTVIYGTVVDVNVNNVMTTNSQVMLLTNDRDGSVFGNEVSISDCQFYDHTDTTR